MPSNTSFSRRALVASAAVLAAPFIMPRPARASTELALGYPLPLNSQFGAAATAFADELARLTQGRFTVKQFPASSLGGEREMIEGVQLGTQPLALVSTGALPNFVPQVAVLDLPFLFRNYAHAQRLAQCPVVHTG